jgi:hypothetical protein
MESIPISEEQKKKVQSNEFNSVGVTEPKKRQPLKLAKEFNPTDIKEHAVKISEGNNCCYFEYLKVTFMNKRSI